jgi:hypothetical protein
VLAPSGWTRTVYRLLLLAYPGEFRHRFGKDMQGDVDRLLQETGCWQTWYRIAADYVQSLRLLTYERVAPAPACALLPITEMVL